MKEPSKKFDRLSKVSYRIDGGSVLMHYDRSTFLHRMWIKSLFNNQDYGDFEAKFIQFNQIPMLRPFKIK